MEIPEEVEIGRVPLEVVSGPELVDDEEDVAAETPNHFDAGDSHGFLEEAEPTPEIYTPTPAPPVPGATPAPAASTMSFDFNAVRPVHMESLEISKVLDSFPSFPTEMSMRSLQSYATSLFVFASSFALVATHESFVAAVALYTTYGQDGRRLAFMFTQCLACQSVNSSSSSLFFFWPGSCTGRNANNEN